MGRWGSDLDGGGSMCSWGARVFEYGWCNCRKLGWCWWWSSSWPPMGVWQHDVWLQHICMYIYVYQFSECMSYLAAGKDDPEHQAATATAAPVAPGAPGAPAILAPPSLVASLQEILAMQPAALGQLTDSVTLGTITVQSLTTPGTGTTQAAATAGAAPSTTPVTLPQAMHLAGHQRAERR